VHGKPSQLFSSGKAAFRFLIQKKIALEDPITAPLVEKDNTLSLWYGTDRRVVIYPCNHNETLNLVLIHPDNESHATHNDGAYLRKYPLHISKSFPMRRLILIS